MVNTPNKSSQKPKKNRGRQSDFSGEKESYLDGLANTFLNSNDRGAFYDEATQGFIGQFGYSHDGKVFVKADTLSTEVKLEYYKALRNVGDLLPFKWY